MPDSVAPRCCPASSQAIDRCVSWLLFNMATCMLWACVLVWRADRPCVRVTSPLRKGERPDTGVRGGGRTFRTWWRPRRRSRSARRPSARRRPRARNPRRRSSSERRHRGRPQAGQACFARTWRGRPCFAPTWRECSCFAPTSRTRSGLAAVLSVAGHGCASAREPARDR